MTGYCHPNLLCSTPMHMCIGVLQIYIVFHIEPAVNFTTLTKLSPNKQVLQTCQALAKISIFATRLIQQTAQSKLWHTKNSWSPCFGCIDPTYATLCNLPAAYQRHISDIITPLPPRATTQKTFRPAEKFLPLMTAQNVSGTQFLWYLDWSQYCINLLLVIHVHRKEKVQEQAA